MVATLTRDEYRAKTHHKYAGTVRQLEWPGTAARWKEAFPDWLGKHWYMHSSPQGTCLSPCNVEPVTRKKK